MAPHSKAGRWLAQIAVSFCACSLISCSGSHRVRPSVPAPPYVVLPESCGALSYGADGNVSPITCPDGRPNRAADKYLRGFKPSLRVLALGPSASPTDVEAAICTDLKRLNTTNPIEQSAYDLAQAEQNWHFGANPSAVILAGCPASP